MCVSEDVSVCQWGCVCVSMRMCVCQWGRVYQWGHVSFLGHVSLRTCVSVRMCLCVSEDVCMCVNEDVCVSVRCCVSEDMFVSVRTYQQWDNYLSLDGNFWQELSTPTAQYWLLIIIGVWLWYSTVLTIDYHWCLTVVQHNTDYWLSLVSDCGTA